MNDSGEWLGIAGIAILLAWYALAAVWLAWRRHVPEPPKPEANLSPAEARFLLKGRFDGRTLLVAILDLVARRALSLKQRPNGTSYLERSLDTVGDDDLPGADALVRASLFRAGNLTVDLTDAREDALLHTGIALRSWLERRYMSDPNIARLEWVILLAGGALLSLAILYWNATPASDELFAVHAEGNAIVTFIFSWLVLGTIWGAITCLRHMRGSQIALIVMVVAVAVFFGATIVVFTVSRISLLYELQGTVGIIQLAIPVLGIAALVAVARPRVIVPRSAAEKMSELRGRLVTSQQALDVSDFHKLPTLPYAAALDCAGAQFETWLSVLDDLQVPSSRVSLFGRQQAATADLGSFGHMATRAK